VRWRPREPLATPRPRTLTGVRRLTALLVAIVLSAGCADDATSSRAPTTTAAVSTTTTTTVPEQDEYAVGRRTIEVVDPTRGTDADSKRELPAEPDRTLPVLLLYPAAGAVPAATEPVDDAPPAPGRFPLVVFSHGWTASGPVYQGRVKEWARAGYIVAAPTYPLSSGRGGVLADYVNQPADVSFVIDQLLALPDDDPLAAHLDGERVAAAGHSLGAITTLGVSLNSCCADDRLDAAVELSGIRLPFPDGAFDDLGLVPFLAVHGAADNIVPVKGSDSLFAEAPGPAAYLRLTEADHTDFLFGDGALLDQVVVAFLDRHLKDDDTGFDAIPEVVAASGQGTLEVKGGG